MHLISILPLQRLRDECIAMHTEDHPYCKALIEAHLACLRLEGFNVSALGQLGLGIVYVTTAAVVGLVRECLQLVLATNRA
jgi:hypothetical protein